MKITLLTKHPENFPACQPSNSYVDASVRTVQSILDTKEILILSEPDNQLLNSLNLDNNQAIFIIDYKSYLDGSYDLIRDLLKHNKKPYIIVINAPNEAELAVKYLKAGAYHYFTEELNYDCLCTIIHEILTKSTLSTNQLVSELDAYFIGNSSCIKKIKEVIPKIAETNCNVLISGETGTGKELVARLIHKLSPRSRKPFIVIDCTTLQETLFESEVFGYEKGAFTGAISPKKGLIELADGGTLFLDEIGDLNLSIQKKFLRFLQEKSFNRLGGTKLIKVDVRIISATNRNLKEEILSGKFRADLYYRLCTLQIYIPPLRERKEDIPLIVEHYLNIKAKELNKEIKGFTKDFIDKLIKYDWPGNVRELINLIERAIILTEGDIITGDVLNEYIEQTSDKLETTSQIALKDETVVSIDDKITNQINVVKLTLHEMEKKLILETLIKNNWNQSRTAKELGISRKQLITKMKKLGLLKERYYSRNENSNKKIETNN